jgi:hypothetical protein
MAQAGFTPLENLYSTTPGAVPDASVLTRGEFGINIADGKVFYKDEAGIIQIIATKNAAAGSFSAISISGGTIDNTLIGSRVTAPAKFTNLEYTGTLTGALGVIQIGENQIYKDALGRVGLGTTNLKGLLTLGGASAGSIGPELVLNNEAGAAGDQSAVTLSSAGSARNALISMVDTATGTGVMRFMYGNGSSANSLNEGMRIINGNVGVGTATPWAKLTVVGDIAATGSISGASNGTTVTAPYTSAIPRTLTSIKSDAVNVKDFGAVGNGVANDTSAIQAAINTGRQVWIPAGSYYVTSALTISTPGQALIGEGKDVSYLTVRSTFNMAASGVIVFATGEPGPQLQDFGIRFAQPDTALRSSLTTYPPAIYAQAIPRFSIINMKISNATNGIDMRGNSGGAFIDLLELSAYSTGIFIDGSLDTIRINRYHFYNFDMTNNQAQIFYTAPTRAFAIGRVDGLFIHQFLNISNLGIYTYQGTSGSPWVYVSDSGFDTFNGVYHTAGTLQMSNSYITVAASPNGLSGFGMTGGRAMLSNMYFWTGSNIPMIKVEAAGGGSLSLNQGYFGSPINGVPFIQTVSTLSNFDLQIANTYFDIQQVDTYCLDAGAKLANGNIFQLTNNYVNTSPNKSYSNPMFKFGFGNRVSMSGNRAVDKGSNGSTFISVASDDWNWISGNVAPGWTNSFPQANTGYYFNNLT